LSPQSLFESLADEVDEWVATDCQSLRYPAIQEILQWVAGDNSQTPRYLRLPQLRALRTYWYLRCELNSPRVIDLYTRRHDPATNIAELLEALGVPSRAFAAANFSLTALLERIRKDDPFVLEFGLETLRETLTLDYPSYILALAMGAGKTILIGAIIASEFAMAQEYPDGNFVENALVFAPGKTIIGSLKELLDIDYSQILPPRLFKAFNASLKFTFTPDKSLEIPVVAGSSFNVIVTNTEKIRIQRDSRSRARQKVELLELIRNDERLEIANRRLQAIADLPHLAVFSDEAHHTYGRGLDSELKKVRKTVDFLAHATNVLVVVNTTGTPYYRKQILLDVVVWYGLGEGIRDGILKEVKGSIQTFDFESDVRSYVHTVVRDFFLTYGGICLPNGSRAKLAIYLPTTNEVRELRSTIDAALIEAGQGPTTCLVNTSDAELTTQDDIEAFDNLNDPTSPFRVVILVNKGTEGWNCPSLFACALIRRLKSANNFVLQAATRCLRQVPGNVMAARIYLSRDNLQILDHQLNEAFGKRLIDLERAVPTTRRLRILLRKTNLRPVRVRKSITRVKVARDVSKNNMAATLHLSRPRAQRKRVERTAHDLIVSEQRSVVFVTSSEQMEIVSHVTLDSYTASVELTRRTAADVWAVYDAIKVAYGSDSVPRDDLDALATQVESQRSPIETVTEHYDADLAIVKPEGFTREVEGSGQFVYTTEIAYPRRAEELVLHLDVADATAESLSFHYTPYGFDSIPERSFFQELLAYLRVKPSDVELFLYTGALTDPRKTDFYVSYQDDKNAWHRYTPDFLVRLKQKPGEEADLASILMIEIKDSRFKATIERELRDLKAITTEGRKALAARSWGAASDMKIRYELIFADGAEIRLRDMMGVIGFLEVGQRESER
jgi:type III restriction enzyme